MFEAAPIWTCLIITIPFGVVGMLIYATCTAKRVEEDEDEEPLREVRKALAQKEKKKDAAAAKKKD